MSNFWKLVSWSVLVASSFSCSAEQATSDGGRLDVLVRPDSVEASRSHIEGSFAVRSLDGRTVQRLVVVNPYDTLRVALPQGSYLLDWQPLLAFSSEQDSAALARDVAALGTPLSIVAGRVTTVTARAVVTPDADPELGALAQGIPSVDILIARH